MIKSIAERKPQGIEIDLTGPEGNAFCLFVKAKNLAKQLKLDDRNIINEMKSSDYKNLIQVFEKYFGNYVTLYQ